MIHEKQTNNNVIIFPDCKATIQAAVCDPLTNIKYKILPEQSTGKGGDPPFSDDDPERKRREKARQTQPQVPEPGLMGGWLQGGARLRIGSLP